MFLLRIFTAVIVLFGLPILSQAEQNEPQTVRDWFARASELMNPRTPGATPFHLKVTFHAFPGEELLGPKEKPSIITGDGIYEETWLSVHQWRRETTFAGYHAVEIDSGGVRRMQSSSDYEPGRLLLLLSDLFVPIPRTLISAEYQDSEHWEQKGKWEIEPVKSGEVPLVRVGRRQLEGASTIRDTFFFYHNGFLALRNDWGLVFFHEGATSFAGKAFAKRISIRAGERELVSADVTVEPAQADAVSFDLPVERAEPGNTLLPIQYYQVRKLERAHFSWDGQVNSAEVPNFSLQMVRDRSGRFREAELLYSSNVDTYLRYLMPHLRQDRARPAEIDGSPCQMLEIHTEAPLNPR